VSRIIDRGAIFAGYVGLGMALVIAIAFELIIPVQTIVFIAAPLAGIVIGVYAYVRAERWRPRGRALANAVFAGLVTGLGLAILYVVIRLVFIYGDTGALPNGTALNSGLVHSLCVALLRAVGRGSDVGILPNVRATPPMTAPPRVSSTSPAPVTPNSRHSADSSVAGSVMPNDVSSPCWPTLT
jgi:hypothetical protein